MDYSNWNTQLTLHFFIRAASGRPVYLQVDEAELREVGKNAGLDPAEAETDFVAAVQEKVDGDERFGNIRRLNSMWLERDREASPPFVALLAAAVLAASRMAADPERELGQNNYYVRFNDILGLDLDDAPRGIEFVVDCWRELRNWLIRARGERGLPTAQPGNFRRIGYALSQCVLRSENRRRLGDFFLWKGLNPGDDLELAEIEDDLQRWVQTPSCSFTPRARRLLTDPGRQISELVAQVVSNELRGWDGSEWQPLGVRVAPILLQAEDIVPGRRFALRLVLRIPEDFPSGVFEGDGSSLEIEPQSESPFIPIEIPVTSYLLEGGVTLGQSLARLRFSGAEAFVLERDLDFGGWVSKPQSSLGDECLLIFNASLEYRALSLLEWAAEPGWREASGSWLPSGWRAASGVLFARLFEAPQELAVFEPRLETEVHLREGLKFNERCWMTSAPPRIEIWTAAARQIAVDLDGDTVYQGSSHPDARSQIDIDLADVGLEDGQHELSVLGRTRRFELSSSAPDDIRNDILLIGWELDGEQHALISGRPTELEAGSVAVLGATLNSHAQAVAGRSRSLVFPTGADHAALIGPEPGHYSLLKQRRLHGQQDGYELEWVSPQFSIAWLALCEDGVLRLIPKEHPPPDLVLPNTLARRQMEALDDWKELITGSSFLPLGCGNCRPQCQATYDDYKAACELL